MPKTIAIDADLMVYTIGFSCQQVIDFGDDYDHVHISGDKVRASSMLAAEATKLREHFGTKARIVFCLSDPKENFRKDVLESYKGNRNNSSNRPCMFSFIREWFMHNTECRWEPRLEADDLLGIMATGPERALMVSIDKDLLTIPGILYDPETLTPQKTNAAQAHYNHLFQTLCGDAVDNYKGCPGLGKVKAARLLDEDCSWDAVVAAFAKAHKVDAEEAEELALVQARVAYILHHEDYKDGEVTLWTP